MKRSAWLWAVVGLAGLGLLSVELGCAREEAPMAQLEARPRAESGRGREDAIASLRKLHADVDAAESPAQMRAVEARLESAFEAEWPLQPSEAAPLRQDLAERAARLALAQDRVEEARKWAQKGLDVADGQPFLRANLLVALADAERQANALDSARGHLLEALAINQELLDRELEHP
jgi:hypothetical protein